MNGKHILLGGLIATAALAGTTISADAYRGDPSVKGPLYSSERHAAMTEAFRNNDYDIWKKLMEDRGRMRVTQIINKDNFPRFAEARRLALEGKLDDAKKIRAELGLGLRNGAGAGQRMGQHQWQK